MFYLFCVITEVPPGAANAWSGVAGVLRYGPIFEVGELLVLDGGGREVGYPQRKPSKWNHLGYQIFDTLEEAARVARRIYISTMLNKS